MVTAQIQSGGLCRLKTKDELDLSQNNGEEKYVKLKILPSSYDEYRMLASYIKLFLKKFGIEKLKFAGPDEWSQYLRIEFPHDLQDRQSTIDFINSLGFWACVEDEEAGVIDLADIDLNLLKLIFPTDSFSFKTEPIEQKFSESVTPQHFNLGMLDGISSNQNGKEREPRKKREQSKGISHTQVSAKKEEIQAVVSSVLEQKERKTIQVEDLFGKEVYRPYSLKRAPIPGEFSGPGIFFSIKQPGYISHNINFQQVLSLSKEIVRESFDDAFAHEHQREFVMTIEGVEYRNDSRATNVNALWFTLEIMKKPIIWIAGGQDRGNDYEPILELVRRKVISLICLGTDTSRMVKKFQGLVPEITQVISMTQAVQVAYHKAKSGNVVLLSPGCASFDLFENYEDRGRQFKQAVRAL